MRLIRDEYMVEDDGKPVKSGKIIAKSRKYKERSEQLLKSISAEYTRIVQKYPDYQFSILLDTDSESDKGVLTITWTRVE